MAALTAGIVVVAACTEPPTTGSRNAEGKAIENALDAVLFNNQDVAESLARAQDEVTQSLERYAGD